MATRLPIADVNAVLKAYYGKKACKISGVYADGNISVYSELCKACYKFAMQKGCNEIIISVGKS